MIRSIYLDREDAPATETEERGLFIKSILEQLGVPLEEIWVDISLSVEQVIKLRDLLSKLEIEILDDGDRGTKIYNNEILLAEWKKPRFVLRTDPKARTLAKKLYYEMIIETFSMFEEK